MEAGLRRAISHRCDHGAACHREPESGAKIPDEREKGAGVRDRRVGQWVKAFCSPISQPLRPPATPGCCVGRAAGCCRSPSAARNWGTAPPLPAIRYWRLQTASHKSGKSSGVLVGHAGETALGSARRAQQSPRSPLTKLSQAAPHRARSSKICPIRPKLYHHGACLSSVRPRSMSFHHFFAAGRLKKRANK